MGAVAGNYGTQYFDDLQNGTATFSEAIKFVEADIGFQALGEVGVNVLGYGARVAGDVLPSVGRNVASMFGSSEVNALSPMRVRVMANLVESQIENSALKFSMFTRKDTALQFYLNHGISADRALLHMRGIDFSHDVNPKIIQQGEEAIQYYLPKTKEMEQALLCGKAKINPGNYFAPTDTSANRLGIYPSGRQRLLFFAKTDTPVLESTASAMVDDYSMSEYGWKIETNGGGQQYFSPYQNDWGMK